MNKLKYLLIMALALALGPGVWAQGIVYTPGDVGKVLCTDGSVYATVSDATTDGKTAAAKIIVVNTLTNKGLALALADEGSKQWDAAKTSCTAKNTSMPVSGMTWSLATKDQWDAMIAAAGGYTALRDGFSSVGGTNMQSARYWSSTPQSSIAAYAFKFQQGKWGAFQILYDHVSSQTRACLAFVPDPNALTPNADRTVWTLDSMPASNMLLKVTYFEQPGLTWFYGTDTMPNAGLTVTRGFHADAIQNIRLQVSDTFNTALRGYFELDQVSAPSTWANITSNFLATDIANFVDNSSLTEEQVLTFPNPDPGTNNVYLIYGFDGYAVKYVHFNGTNVTAASYGMTKSNIYYSIAAGVKIFYTTTTVVQGLTLRYGSSNPAVVSFSNPNDMTTFSLNGTGEADIYAVFDGDTTFQYDSVAFHVTVNDPATLTLAQNGNGTVEAETASTDTWNKSTWSSWVSGTDATHTVDGVTISTVNANAYNYGGTTNPLRLAAWSSTGNSITFASDGPNFTRIEMTLVDGNTIQPSDGWTISGNSAVWEGNTDSLVITNCTLKVSQIVFIRENPAIASTNVDGQYIVVPGAEVKVVATAQDGSYLSEWSNGAAVTNRISDTIALTVNETMTLSASFAQNPTLTLASEGNGTVALQLIGKDSTLYSNALNTQALFNQMTVLDKNGHNQANGQWSFASGS
ncbi:MAG: hypothetical protein IJR26_11780, partial [Bacteroidales bacterium]|nr:hypothetical protein [Bacteroidales bacterium]